jgi:rhodanese-related sulfurtransferase
MTITKISAAQARTWLDEGKASLVDVRGADEYAREHIDGAQLLPLPMLSPNCLRVASPVIFYCRSGARTSAQSTALAQAAGGPAYVLDGGLEAWRAAGLPTKIDRSQPLEIMRQVQLVAGALILTGVLLGWFVAPGFFGLSAFVGAGLMFAGATGWCGMAKLLAHMPWNRIAAQA